MLYMNIMTGIGSVVNRFWKKIGIVYGHYFRAAGEGGQELLEMVAKQG
jgi:hypothetical protein